MKFMTVAFSLSGKFWQFGAGLKTGHTRFKQTSALLRKASFFSQNVFIYLNSPSFPLYFFEGRS